MPDVRIRPAERDDAFALAALRLQLDREAGRAPRAGFLDEYADAWLAEGGGYRGWLAEAGDGDPVGCLLALRVRTLPTLAAPGRPEWWSVQQVYVRADRRRDGVGTALVGAAQAAAREGGVGRLRLDASDADRALVDATGFGPPVEGLREWRPT